jgi:RNA polymerase sigma-70 factor (ECF subfamily)
MAGSPVDPLDVRTLYEQYGRAVYRRCQYFLKQDEDARDALHDVFLKVIERAAEFRGEASPFTWVVRITTNHCLNLLRSKKALWRERFAQEQRVVAESPGLPGARLEKAELVWLVLGKVDRDCQTAAVHYFVDEMTQGEAAQASGCSVPTLRKRLRRFIEVARRSLDRARVDAVFGPPPI